MRAPILIDIEPDVPGPGIVFRGRFLLLAHEDHWGSAQPLGDARTSKFAPHSIKVIVNNSHIKNTGKGNSIYFPERTARGNYDMFRRSRPIDHFQKERIIVDN